MDVPLCESTPLQYNAVMSSTPTEIHSNKVDSNSKIAGLPKGSIAGRVKEHINRKLTLTPEEDAGLDQWHHFEQT